jgi:8-oxo-dGTP pyrophosphatase MutT (NUDIX family)
VFRDHNGELRVLLVRRGMRGIHGGQVGLPGGKQEPGDRSPLETALREAEEEIGLARAQVRILTALDPVDTRTSGFRVYAFLGGIASQSTLRPAPGEISGLLTPSVRALADPSARAERELTFATWPASRRVQCVRLEKDQLLWGLTLELLDPLLRGLLCGKWSV